MMGSGHQKDQHVVSRGLKFGPAKTPGDWVSHGTNNVTNPPSNDIPGKALDTEALCPHGLCQLKNGIAQVFHHQKDLFWKKGLQPSTCRHSKPRAHLHVPRWRGIYRRAKEVNGRGNETHRALLPTGFPVGFSRVRKPSLFPRTLQTECVLSVPAPLYHVPPRARSTCLWALLYCWGVFNLNVLFHCCND